MRGSETSSKLSVTVKQSKVHGNVIKMLVECFTALLRADFERKVLFGSLFVFLFDKTTWKYIFNLFQKLLKNITKMSFFCESAFNKFCRVSRKDGNIKKYLELPI